MEPVRRSSGRWVAAWVLVGAAALGGCGALPTRQADRRRVDPWAARRDAAVLRGMAWMEAFLAREGHLDELALDAVYIFLELSASSSNAEIRTRARAAARRYAAHVAKGLLAEERDKPRDNWDVADLLDLLAEAGPLGLDRRQLGEHAAKGLELYGTFEALHGTAFKDLAGASEADLFDTVMSVYSAAKAEAACGEAFAVRPGLAEVLTFLKGRPLVAAADDTSKDKALFQDHAYLATHTAYILSNYGRLRLRWDDAPRVYRYLRANFNAVLADKDIELVAEIVDVFRSLGRGEADDADVLAGTEFLLGCQNEDGSWGPWPDEEDPYDAIHYTWCAVGALRGRVFLRNTPYGRYLRRVLWRVNR